MNKLLFLWTLAAGVLWVDTALAQSVPRQALSGHVPAVVSRLTSTGRLPATNRLQFSIGLPLRSTNELAGLLAEIYSDPSSLHYRHYLTVAEFTQRFGPTEADYTSVVAFALAHGFRVSGTYSNRMVVDAEASVADVEKAFQVTLRTYRHPTEARDFFAPEVEPTLELATPVLHISGLDNLILPRALHWPQPPGSKVTGARPQGGSAPYGFYQGNDFRAVSVAGGYATSSLGLQSGITLARSISLGGRQPLPNTSGAAAQLINLSGTNTLLGAVTSSTGGNQYNIESAGGLLIMAGNFSQASGTLDRYLNLQGDGDALWTGTINDGTARINVTKRGNGVWTLAGTNSYSGATLVAAGTLKVTGILSTNALAVAGGGTLAGNGKILGPVTIQSGGILSPGTSVPGRLLVSNSLTLGGGCTNVFRLDPAAATNDSVGGLVVVNYGGTLLVTNRGGGISAGQAFKLFDAAGYEGNFSSVNLPDLPVGRKWLNRLAVDGSIAVYNTNACGLNWAMAGSSVTLSWPADHLGWRLQVQTNSLAKGLGTNWMDVPNSGSATNLNIPLNTDSGAVYYLLIFP